MPRIDKKRHEAQLLQVWRMLLANKTHDEIANELGVSTKTIQRMSLELDKRYGEIQRQKTDDAIYAECQLFKNRMLRLYRGLEAIVTDDFLRNGSEKAKCAEVAANIAIDILKMESESIRSVKNISGSLSDQRNYAEGNRLLGTIRQLGQQQGGQQPAEQQVHDDVAAGRVDDQEETC